MSRTRTGSKPLRQQRSKWTLIGERVVVPGEPAIGEWQRNVTDGHLMALVGQESIGWHLSISHRTNTHPPQPGRYPTWDEIVHARESLLPDDVPFVMHLPTAAEFVSLHDTTFHLHEATT